MNQACTKAARPPNRDGLIEKRCCLQLPKKSAAGHHRVSRNEVGKLHPVTVHIQPEGSVILLLRKIYALPCVLDMARQGLDPSIRGLPGCAMAKTEGSRHLRNCDDGNYILDLAGNAAAQPAIKAPSLNLVGYFSNIAAARSLGVL